MDLYFSPLACSMATRIALYEAGAEAGYVEVDPRTKVVQKDGSDFRKVNPLGLVPTLRTDDGTVLTENAAILQYVADHFPKAGIAAGPGMERSRLHQWLCFIGTELHKGLFVPLLDKKAAPEVKSWVLKNLSRLDYLDKPSFFFKLVAISFAIVGHDEFAARLPSAVFALGTLGAVYYFCRREYNLRTAAVAV